MKIKMTKTMQGSPDGIAVITYLRDEVIDIPDDLARVFLKMSVAVENKMVGNAPENKAAPIFEQTPEKEEKPKRGSSK